MRRKNCVYDLFWKGTVLSAKWIANDVMQHMSKGTDGQHYQNNAGNHLLISSLMIYKLEPALQKRYVMRSQHQNESIVR